MDAFDWRGCYDVGGLASTSLHAGARDALGCRAIGDLFDVGLLSGVLRRGNSRRAARNKGSCSVVGRAKASLIFRPPCNSSVPQCDLSVSVVVVCSSISPPRHRGHTDTERNRIKSLRSSRGGCALVPARYCSRLCNEGSVHPPSASSITDAAANTVNSSFGRPITCTPIGNPFEVFPAGTATLGSPKTLNVCE